MAEFEVNGALYRAGKMDAFRQFHVARRLAPVVGSLGSLSQAARNPVEALAPVAQAIAGLSDADCEYVLGTCLGVVQRQQGNAWANIWNASAKRPMFEDIDLPAMLQIAMHVLQDTLGGFFLVPPSASSGGDQPASLSGR